MPPNACACTPTRPSAADIDARIRTLAAGRVSWTAEALREWQELTRAWAAATREAVVPAA